MKRIEKVATELLAKAKNYGAREYCECGCKNREDWDHGAKGKWEYLEFLKTLSPKDAKLLAKAVLEKQ